MFEEDLLDEEIKKKKRRVLMVLLILFLLGVLATLPMTEILTPSPTTVAQATSTAIHLPPTATNSPTPLAEATTASPAAQVTPTAAPDATSAVAEETPVTGIGGGMPDTPPPAETDDMTPGVEETAPTGVGGGTPALAVTATDTLPTETASATFTPAPPGELPVTGTKASSVSAWLAAGLVLLLLGAGTIALRNIPPSQRGC